MQMAPPATDELALTFASVRRLGLEQNIAELDAFGYTVVEPDKVAPPEFHKRMLEAILEVHERNTGERITDLDGGELAGTGAGHFGMVLEDPVFEEALLNPVTTTLAHYLVGRSAILSDMVTQLKSRHRRPTHDLHTDAVGMPPPLPQYAQVANVTWISTDYTRANGAVAIVPGSHRFGRHPYPHEENFLAEDAPFKPIAVEAPAGSIICWHGNTWHGAWPRDNRGIRVNTIMYFCRSYVRPMQDLARRVSDEALQRNPPEFADLLGREHPYPLVGNKMSGPDSVLRFLRSGMTPWA